MQNKDYQKLRECPFCGRLEPRLQERYVQGTANRKHYRYECPACHGTRNTWYRSIGKARSGWNRRAQPDNAPLTLEQQSKPDNTTAAANPYWQRVCAIADKQRAKGIAEYGQGLEDNPADIARRITYLEEEMVDGLMYCEWIKARLDGERPESADR